MIWTPGHTAINEHSNNNIDNNKITVLVLE